MHCESLEPYMSVEGQNAAKPLVWRFVHRGAVTCTKVRCDGFER
jgi:hypothetical protein